MGRSSGVGTRKESAESELDELPCCRRMVRDRLRNSFLKDDEVDEAAEVDFDEEGEAFGDGWCGKGDTDAADGSESRKLKLSYSDVSEPASRLK